MIVSVETFLKMFAPERVQQLASDFNVGQGKPVYSAALVTEILTNADGYVKTELGRQYTAAQLEADDGIARITGDIAMYYMEARRSSKLPEGVVLSYKKALDFIKRLQQGTTKLFDVTELLPMGNTTEPTEATDSGYFGLEE